MIVLNGNDEEFVATSSGCSTNGEYCKVSAIIVLWYFTNVVDFYC